MNEKEMNVWACRGVAIFVLTLLTFLESLFILMLFTPINLFTLAGALALLRVFVIAAPFNAAVFLFAIRYQAVKSRCGGICEGACLRKFNDQSK